jgi:hypothetical protein
MNLNLNLDVGSPPTTASIPNLAKIRQDETLLRCSKAECLQTVMQRKSITGLAMRAAQGFPYYRQDLKATTMRR